MSRRAPSGPIVPRGQRLLALLVFAAAMGWLEAVVVVYIRGLLGIAHAETIPAESEVLARMRALPWLLPTEQTREVATLTMIAAAGWFAADRWRARLGAFLIVFGIWDLAYYGGLYALLRWPPSLATKDLLFLIPPHPWWYQPVWVPMAIATAMVLLGFRLFVAGPPRSGRAG
jgi:hypothetical protein